MSQKWGRILVFNEDVEIVRKLSPSGIKGGRQGRIQGGRLGAPPPLSDSAGGVAPTPGFSES